MRRIPVLIIAMFIASSATMASAAMPKALKGSWILDAEATQKYVKTSPKWKVEDEKYLPTIIKRMSQMSYEFTSDSIVVSMRGKKQSLPVTLKKSEPKKYVFEGKIGDKSVTMTVSFIDEKTVNIRSSGTDDMHYYLWKRGSLTDKKGASDKALAVEVMKKSMQSNSSK